MEDKALELIKSSPKGVLQSDLWKELAIDSRKCSRVVAKLEVESKIKRTWETVSGTRTYRLSYVPQKKEAPKKEYRFDLIMAVDMVAPCVGCTYECEPDYCPDLGNWIELLARDAMMKPQKIGAKEASKVAVKEAAKEVAEEPPATPKKAEARKETMKAEAKKPEAKKPEPKKAEEKIVVKPEGKKAEPKKPGGKQAEEKMTAKPEMKKSAAKKRK